MGIGRLAFLGGEREGVFKSAGGPGGFRGEEASFRVVDKVGCLETVRG